MHTFHPGQIVTVINQTMGGRFVLEGEATIIKPVADIDEQYVVRFGKGRYADVCERFVDPQAQGDPEAFIAKLNARVA